MGGNDDDAARLATVQLGKPVSYADTVQLQQGLADPAATHGVALRVRCGLHAGVTERRDNDFFGGTVNRAARIMSVAHGGQILLSQAVATLLGERLPPDTMLRELGTVRLRGLETPERVFQLVHPRLRQEFPALRSLEATPTSTISAPRARVAWRLMAGAFAGMTMTALAPTARAA